MYDGSVDASFNDGVCAIWFSRILEKYFGHLKEKWARWEEEKKESWKGFESGRKLWSEEVKSSDALLKLTFLARFCEANMWKYENLWHIGNEPPPNISYIEPTTHTQKEQFVHMECHCMWMWMRIFMHILLLFLLWMRILEWNSIGDEMFNWMWERVWFDAMRIWCDGSLHVYAWSVKCHWWCKNFVFEQVYACIKHIDSI